MKLLKLTELDLNQQRVFIRADLNVPQDDTGKISDDARIRASLPAIEHALRSGAAVMVTSHLGRPTEGQFTEADSLVPVAQRLAQLLKREVPLLRDWVNGVTVSSGQVVLLENCRFNSGEKKNDAALAKKMAALCDIYCNDAFGTAHRAEATTYGIAQYAKLACAGPLLVAELDALSQALENPRRPLIAIVGGAKISTKLTVLKNLAAKVDKLILGGGIANTFLLAKGIKVGKSLAEPDLVGEAQVILAANADKIPLPIDVVCAKEFSATAMPSLKEVDKIADDDLILDIGERSQAALKKILVQAGTIVWNGPVGVFEWEAFSMGTKTLAQAIGNSPAFSIAGGGDTLAAIAKYGIEKKIDYISTGGGAFLEFLEGKKLPAVDILEQRAKHA